jgi:hypothetical protein
MNPRRSGEDYHHSPEQVHGYVKQAGVIMDDFDLTELERAHLGPVLVQLLSQKQLFYEQVVGGGLALPQNARH